MDRRDGRDPALHAMFGAAMTNTKNRDVEDGFLAPYKVIRIGLDEDLDGWRTEAGKVDKYGQPMEDREYNQLDYDRAHVLGKRAPPTIGDSIHRF